MAKGDTTLTCLLPHKPGYAGAKQAVIQAVLDNYKTGGYTADLSAFNLGTIKLVKLPPALAGYLLEYDYTNKKILVYQSAALTAGALSLTTTVTPSVSATVSERLMLSLTRASVPNGQSDIELFQHTATEDLVVVGAKVYCTGTTANASVDVKIGGASILSAAVTPSAGADVNAALTTPNTALASAAVLTVHATTDGTGAITNLVVHVYLGRTATASVTASATGATTGNGVGTTAAAPLAELTDNSAALNGQAVIFEAIGIGV